MTCRFCNGYGYVVIMPSTRSEGGRATCGNCLPEHLRNTSTVVSHETAIDVTQAVDRIAELEARVGVLETFNSELRRYLYDRTPERREKVVERFALRDAGGA